MEPKKDEKLLFALYMVVTVFIAFPVGYFVRVYIGMPYTIEIAAMLSVQFPLNLFFDNEVRKHF